LGGGFLGQRAISDAAFDKLEADRVAEDSTRIRIALDYEVRLLKNYGATNSLWDNTYDEVGAGDHEGFASDMPPSDVSEIFGLDGVVGVGPDGSPRVGGIVGAADEYDPLPADLADPAILARMYDPDGEVGSGTCGVADSTSCSKRCRTARSTWPPRAR
jgi:sensor domain CHASE-containing protein